MSNLPTPERDDMLPCPHCGDKPTFYGFGRSDYSHDWEGKLGCCAEMEASQSWRQSTKWQPEEISKQIADRLVDTWNKRWPTHVYKIEIDATSSIVESTNSHAKSST